MCLTCKKESFKSKVCPFGTPSWYYLPRSRTENPDYVPDLDVRLFCPEKISRFLDDFLRFLKGPERLFPKATQQHNLTLTDSDIDQDPISVAWIFSEKN